ncbi:MAG: response regulator [Lachnospiraceae bacterium]|nr:response regulator [Lachnospiraceae bacterium]MBR5993454.1 response regulator [Lachnospiraceae bacterium]
MYRVMLIDDEQSARSLLKASINWERYDMEVAGEAASGIEAINIIDEIVPDIAFVDISMPFMNGIEFTEVATKRYPGLKIIIMTAFDEFEYARQCIRLPVFDYMLKPFVRAEVEENLKKLKDILDRTVKDTEPAVEIEPSSIGQIKRYIEDNYTDSKLNLTSVAQIFGFSASYLSRKFKQDTGKNFVEYLTECRMKRAMELAASNMKMFSASTEVGIPDPNYFGRCFKKYTGQSYSDYASSVSK